MSETDALAISLFVRDGNPREDWPLVDEAVRLHYRKLVASAFTQNDNGAAVASDAAEAFDEGRDVARRNPNIVGGNIDGNVTHLAPHFRR